jgi:hypothetical protein
MNQTIMKRMSIVVLQVMIVLVGMAVLAFLVRFPMTEGRAKDLDLFSIYTDPFILYGYAASIPFFVALFQLFKLLGLIRQHKTFSLSAVAALKNTRHCAIAFSALVVAAVVYISIAHNKEDDPAGFLAIGMLTTLLSVLVAIVAARFEKFIQQRMD